MSLDSPSKTRVPLESAIIIGGWQGTEEDKAKNIDEYGPTRNCTILKQDGSNTSWKRTKYVTEQPVCYSGSCFLDPYVYIVGGYDGNINNNGGMNNCYKFDVNLCAWSEIAPLKQERLYLACCSYPEKNCIFAIGGGTKGFPRMGTWDELRDYINRDYINSKGKLKLVEKYDISTNEWTRLPNMHEYRSDCSAIISNDKLFVAGGFNGSFCLKSVEYYDFEYNNHWVKLKDMTLPRSGLGLIYYDNSLVVIGGYGGRRKIRRRRKIDQPYLRFIRFIYILVSLCITFVIDTLCDIFSAFFEKTLGYKLWSYNGARRNSCEMLKCFEEESDTNADEMQTRKRTYSLKEDEEWKVLPLKMNTGRSNFGACVVKGYFFLVLC